MAQVNTTSTLSGLFKEVYGDGPTNLIPDVAQILKRVQFRESERLGNAYHMPVVLSGEHGVTVAASGDGAVTLNSSVAATMKDAQISGSTFYIRGQLSYDAAAKATGSKQAFRNATELLVENLTESLSKRLEIACLYGQKGLGKITGTPSTINTSNKLITFLTASFAAGIWAGMEGASLDAYNGASKINTNAALVVVAVDVDARTIEVSGNATDLGNLADTHDIYFKGAYGKEFAGLDKIITNTSTLFNIDAASYNLWKGSSYAVGGAISMSAILAAVGQGVSRGLSEKVVVFLNPKKWSVLNSNEAALRKYDGSYDSKKFENGAQSIVFHGPNGEIEVVSHSCVKEGEGFIIPMKRVKRVGACDVTFKLPGQDGDMFLHVPDSASYEMRAMADQAIFVETPARCIKLTGIS